MASVEWLILADSAQVVGNKLYLLGGGWDVLTIRTSFPVQHRLAVAAAFRVPWVETNQKHDGEIQIVTEDGKEIVKMEAQFEVGRPAGIKAGQDQRLQLAVDLALTFDAPGTYAIAAKIEGQELMRTHFNVVAAPGVPMVRPSQ